MEGDIVVILNGAGKMLEYYKIQIKLPNNPNSAGLASEWPQQYKGLLLVVI